MYWKIIKRILFAIAFLAFSTQIVPAGVLPVGSPEYEFIYDRLEHIQALERSLEDFQLGPYPVNLITPVRDPVKWISKLSGRQLALFGFMGEDFSSIKYAEAQGFESVRGGIAAQPLDKLFIYGRFGLDERKADNPDYSGKKWRGLAGDVEQAFAYVHTGGFNLFIGRFASFWGPRESLALASNVSMDGLAYSFRWGRLTLSYRLAHLDGLNPDEDDVDQFENRYFASHRLDLHLSSRCRIGFFETAIFGGPGRQIELYYLNPLIFFHSSQLNEGQNDNTLLGFDFDLKPAGGLKLFGQLLVDDFQIDRKSQGDEEPSEYAVLIGGYAADWIPKIDIKATYTRVTNWTFNQNLPRNRYISNGKPIGAVLGNDYDLISVSLYRWFGNYARAAFHVSHQRQGEGRIDAEWTAPWSHIEGDYTEPFPTGVVEQKTRFSLGYTRFVLNNFFLDIEAGVDKIRNVAHVTDDNQTLPFVQLNLSAFFSSKINVE
ncbi:MAG: hypothetical protein DRP47_00330 [Candidatus Zixiibacteriota bacterium]|nr:MAG: hypothetical protein DRP47_00330 [candidate division Zixibacteria bacterium]